MTWSKHQVFIIEDSPDDISLILDTLGDKYDPRVYTSGETALRELRKQPPSLVLLDVRLPGVDGFEVCRLLKSFDETADIPIIFLTSEDSSKAEGKCLMLGAADFIKKPVDPEILKRRVQNQIDLLEHMVSQQELYEKLSYKRECDAISNVVITLLNAMDKTTGEHIENTRELYYVTANCFATYRPDLFVNENIDLMAQASSMHDIGKSGIHSAILGKSGALSVDELAQVRQHPRIGGEMIEKLEKVVGQNVFLSYAREMALFHHEKWNGNGYPFSLKGNAIPLCARIMSLVDVYDALTSNRTYRKALPHDTAVRIITEGDGWIQPGDFDPELINAFLLVEDEIVSLQNQVLARSMRNCSNL